MTAGQQLVIGRARPQDATALRELIIALAEFEQLAHLCTGTEAQLREALAGDPPVVEALLARLDGRVVGFALYFHTFSTFLAQRGLWLEDLFVTPQARGRGVGKALVRAVAQVAHGRRCGRFEWSVLDWNAPAIRFYEALGASILPDWRIARVTSEGIAALARSDGKAG